jgi:hypothetical protein
MTMKKDLYDVQHAQHPAHAIGQKKENSLRPCIDDEKLNQGTIMDL